MDAVTGAGRTGRSAKSRSATDGTRSYMIVGETPVARRVCATLTAEDPAISVRHLIEPSDPELEAILATGVEGAAILIRDDVSALRYAFAVAHLDQSVPLVVTIFDTTIAEQLCRFLPQASVISPALLAVPSLIGPCLGPAVLATFARPSGRLDVVRQHQGINCVWDLQPRSRLPLRDILANRWSGLRHQQPGSRLLTLGLLGLLLVLLLECLWLRVLESKSLAASYAEAARVVATVGPAPEHASTAYTIFSGTAMLLTMLFAALFTAGVVERLVAPPWAGIIGQRAVPKRQHVIVVGMGQVGIRLCVQLREHGIPVVGVERDDQAALLPLARRLGIPVVVGQGTDRRVLERLQLSRCRALAAVASDELDNIAVAVAASAVSPRTPVVLRAGEQEAIGETLSLLPLGVTRDVTAIAAGYVVAEFQNLRPRAIVADATSLHAILDDDILRDVVVSPRAECRHRSPSQVLETAVPN